MTERDATGRGLLVRWAGATWAGWVLGVPLVVVLALLGEAVSVGGAQWLVGAGMGAGVGLMQGRVVRGLVGRAAPWFWSCAVGLAAPFLLTDISKALGWGVPYSLPACVAAGGLVAGCGQALLLRPRMRATWTWAAACALGWTLAATTAWAADYLQRSRALRGLSGALAFLGVVAAGGLILGLTTGVCLALMSRRARAARDDSTL